MADGSRLPLVGASRSRQRTIAAAFRMWNLYRQSSLALVTQYPDPWDTSTLAVVTNIYTYAGLAKYCICDHTYNDVETLVADTIILYLGALLTYAKDRLVHLPDVSGETVKFFQCNIPGAGTPIAASWTTLKGEGNERSSCKPPTISLALQITSSASSG